MRRKPDDHYQNPLEARKKAMDYLARREYGRRELERKLASAGFDIAVSADAVAQLNSDGLQDDRRFTEAFVRSRVHQGKGPARVRADLGERGVSGELVEAILSDMSVDWFAQAAEIRIKKFGPDQPADFKEKARQMKFLQYRGFEQEHIQAAVDG